MGKERTNVGKEQQAGVPSEEKLLTTSGERER